MWTWPDAIIPGAVQFLDTFTDIDGTAISAHVPTPGPGGAYSSVNPGVTIQGNKAVATGGGSGDGLQAALNPPGWTGVVELDFQFDSINNDYVAAIGIFSNPGEGQNITLQVLGNGTAQLAASFASFSFGDTTTWTPDTLPHKLALQYDGSRVTAYLDGGLLLRHSMPAASLPGGAHRSTFFALNGAGGGNNARASLLSVAALPR